MSGRPVVIDAEGIGSAGARWLAERAEVLRVGEGDPEAWEAGLRRAAALVVRTYTRVGPALLERAPGLRVVGRAGVGLDNIDVPACRGRGIEVVHTPEANAPAVAEYVFALLLDVLRPRDPVRAPADPVRWNALRDAAVAPRQLMDLTLGILGFGRVGSRVARAGTAFGMRVLYHDLREIPPEARGGATPVDAPTLAAASDVFSIHVDERPQNRGLVGSGAFARLRDDVILLNTSRGFVIDTPALHSFLASRPRALALLDVHDPEPIPAGSPLWELPNVRLYPHLASATRTAKDRMSQVVEDVWRVLTGLPPLFPAP